ncbi:glycosyltransferase family 4 protein [Marinilactibacillus piezotolerans]|uniref:glycosyltransferase family 4 protein n=1 Tax=Marinilactibacillus piezotolerans TaxID=258723 RepID=UPI0009AFF606|nr:glycosyltransferase family 4 protein [Marinilactibacillus piezotolerans]
MNILFIATYPEMTGATNSLIGLVRELKKLNYNPIVILKSKGYLTEKLNEIKIKYYIINYYDNTIGENELGNFKHFFKFILKKTINNIANTKVKSIILKDKIDILHINASTVNVGYKAAKSLGIPIVWHIREFLEADHKIRLIEPKKSINEIREAVKVIAISNSVKEKYSGVVNNTKLVTVFNGVDSKTLETLEKKTINIKKIQIGIVGRISPSKGQLEVIKAFGELKEKGYNNIFLNIIGPTHDKKYQSELTQYVKKNFLGKYVSLKGPKHSVEEIWGNLDIVIIASGAEAFGRVTIEAMLANKISIGANVAGTQEIFKFVKSNLLYESHNHLSLLNCIEKVLKNIKYYSLETNRIKNIVLENFTAEINAKNISLIYEDISKEMKEQTAIR